MIKKIFAQYNNYTKNKKGFAMLFTVLVVTLILSIAIGISNTTLKQTILSSLAKDSQISFYEADTAVECGMYYESQDYFPPGTSPGDVRDDIYCGDKAFRIDATNSYTDYLIFLDGESSGTSPCSTIVFDKTYTSGLDINIVQGRGYNTCSFSPRQVERALEVRYDATI